MESNSEVARLTKQIEDEYNAAHAALHGLAAGTARHDIIAARMENAQRASEHLIETIGHEAALPMIAKAMEGTT